MAFTKQDVTTLKEMFTAQDARFEHRLKVALAQQSQDIKRNIRDEMDARFVASENKMDKKLLVLKQEIRSEFLDVLQTNILPVIDKAFQEIREIRSFVGMKS